jgi:hypothetical protein
MDSLRVAIRIRPELCHDDCVSVNNDKIIMRNFKGHSGSSSSSTENDTAFKFDQIFNDESTQEDVFDSVKPLIDECIKGFTVTIFAFG